MDMKRERERERGKRGKRVQKKGLKQKYDEMKRLFGEGPKEGRIKRVNHDQKVKVMAKSRQIG
jgi:hypothetical protein